ncbi:MAG TPA: hypothetical protein VK550_14985 [Polyangiaceae bacterium]|nr:hypothetical protein [Polyangiaceae bacterium]
MVWRNQLRSQGVVVARASLGACLAATIGCSVYDEGLLARNDDSVGIDVGIRPDDHAKNDGSSPFDSATTEREDARLADANATDSPSNRDAANTHDASAPDDAAGDANRSRSDAAMTGDAGGAPDVAESSFDVTFDRIDADAQTPSADGSDATLADASGTDTAVLDGASSFPDVENDGAGGFPPPTFRVVRVGDGTTPLSAESVVVLIEERAWDGDIVGRPLALPKSASGDQQPLTLSGSATSEGALSLSSDGRYLTLAGYATSPGRANIANSTGVERVIARIDAASKIDTTTVLGDVFSGGNPRSAASVDGASFWVGGSSSGVWYLPLGGSRPTQIVTTPSNVRLVALFGDQLYGCSGAFPLTGVFSIGYGKPTSGAQSVAAFDGMPRSGTSPYAFALFDRKQGPAGPDTLYLADDRSPEIDGNGGGIQKWTWNGSTWSRVATFTAVGSGTASFRGVAGFASSTGITLVGSTAETSANRLVVFVDDGSPGPVGLVVATAPSNTIFRGVALSPHF